jgi:CheY-like chemotaxis protein
MAGASLVRRVPTNPPALLCVDDHAIYLPVRKAYLELHGYVVLTASSGREGLQLLAEHRIDGVVLDYRMPEMDGAEVAREIRRTRPDLPIIMLSGYPHEIPADVRSLVNAAVMKGESPTALLEALYQVLPNPVLQPHAATASRDSIQQTRRQVQRVKEAAAERLRRISGKR